MASLANTAVEMLPAIGQKVAVRFESLRVQCIVRDCRRVWNRNDLLVVPVSGVGEQWVSLERVTAVFPQEGIVS